MFHGLVKDSAALYIGAKMVKKARRKSKDVEVFTPEFKALVKEAFDKWYEGTKVSK
jgi:ethanolamine utilization protein EutA (predicted chaperonin)